MKYIFAAMALFFLSISCFAQNNNFESRYPNELKDFQLMRTTKLKVLVPGVSTAEEVRKFYGECKSRHKRTSGCELDQDWYFNLAQIETIDGRLDSIRFYPRKRIPFSNVKFSEKFEKSELGIVHSINATKFIMYSDKDGLSYVIVDEAGDDEFMKGDLFYIEYGMPETDKNR